MVILNKSQCSRVRRLYDDSFREWKIITLRLIKNAFGISLKFHSNLACKRHHVKSFPDYYRDILLNWKRHLSQKPEVPSWIVSQNLISMFKLIRNLFIWSNFLIKTYGKRTFNGYNLYALLRDHGNILSKKIQTTLYAFFMVTHGCHTKKLNKWK